MKLRKIAQSQTLQILSILLICYVPFLGDRVIRTAGDEKVYVSQSLEMARAGRWFVQTLHDVPDYRKGPFHYLCLLLGMDVFGLQTWATVYMNVVLLILGALSLASLVRRRLPAWTGGPVFVAIFFGLCVGVYSHASASQMEVECAALFAVGINLLDRAGKDRRALGFWLIAGLVGWVKSPMHSGFMGVSALLYWAMRGELVSRLKNLRTYVGVSSGVALCVLGYLPALIADRSNFLQLYLLKETLQKSTSGQHWSVPLASTLGFYLFPWVGIAAVSYVATLVRARQWWKSATYRPVVLLGMAWVLPSVLFFLWHPYRFENYNLPVISGVILWVSALWAMATLRWQKFYRGAIGLTALAAIILAVAVGLLVVRFHPMPEWWPGWLLPVSILCAGFSVGGLYWFGIRPKSPDLGRISWSLVGIYLLIGSLISVLGQRELVDVRNYLQIQRSRGEHAHLTYYNMHRNIWSEWGMLGFWLGEPVRSLHTPEALKQAIEEKDIILVPYGDFLGKLEQFRSENLPQMRLLIFPWKRWRTQGKAENGNRLWQEAWSRRDLKLLERDFYIVRPY